jgi:hypothetical protein
VEDTIAFAVVGVIGMTLMYCAVMDVGTVKWSRKESQDCRPDVVWFGMIRGMKNAWRKVRGKS